MNIVNTLTLRHLKLNKKRTIVTIIGVILSVSMITAVPTFVTSFLNMMQRSVIEDTGNWHVLYRNVPFQKVNMITEHKNTASAILSRDIGYSVLEGSKNEDKPYLFFKSYDKQGFKDFKIKLLEGRFPEKSNEIVISSHIADNGGVVYKIGDVLKLDIGHRYTVEPEADNGITDKEGENTENDENSGDLLDQNTSFQHLSEDHIGEKLVTETTEEYTITGIMSRPNFEPYWAPGYTVISYLDKDKLTSDDTVNVSVTWKNINKKANEDANKLGGKLGFSVNSLTYNRELLRYYGILGNEMLSAIFSVSAIVIALIIIGSVALIFNSFAISISERSRHLGMLASVGATKKQRKRSVFFEGFIVGIIGIPIGIFFGTLGMGITFILVRPLMAGFFNSGVRLSLVTSPITILVAVLVSAFTIFISAYIPAKRAAKVSPVDAIRQTQDIKLTKRSVKTSKLTRIIFGFEAELALKNLKRNSKRYKATIFSLVISIVLFLTVSSLSLLTHKSAEIITNTSPYNMVVYVTSSATAQEQKDFYDAISNLEYVDKCVIEQNIYCALKTDGSIFSDKIRPFFTESSEDNESSDNEPNNNEPNNEKYNIYFEIEAIDEAALNQYAKEFGVDINRLKDTTNPSGILVNTVSYNQDNKYIKAEHFNLSQGEKLRFSFEAIDGPEENSEEEYITELEIAALADKTPLDDTMLSNISGGLFIVSEEVFASIGAELTEAKLKYSPNVFINIQSSNSAKLTESIREYQKKSSIANVEIYDREESERSARNANTFIFVFFYGFIALITAICVTNIFNTISTSISLRKREFAMLKSVGMTPEGFNKMINYESIFYGIKALTYGLPISFGVLYLLYGSMNESFEFTFVVPWGSVLIAVIAVFVIVGSTMLYSSSKLKKENIIDTLKGENI